MTPETIDLDSEYIAKLEGNIILLQRLVEIKEEKYQLVHEQLLFLKQEIALVELIRSGEER